MLLDLIKPLLPTAERTSATIPSNNYVFKRSLKAYDILPGILNGQVLEVGTGTGYGLPYVSGSADIVISLDKCNRVKQTVFEDLGNVVFMEYTLPPMRSIPSNYFDAVVCYQFIEHIENDGMLLRDIARILKPGGILCISTPNAEMTLSRNPWHVREYTPKELADLVEQSGFTVDRGMGVFGNEVVMEYYHQNRIALNKFRKFDLFNLEERSNSALWRTAYDVLNALNRMTLNFRGDSVNDQITLSDFEIRKVTDRALDLLYMCRKV